jgi:radical SAM protein with 4Fe4S-binding SPASM domain
MAYVQDPPYCIQVEFTEGCNLGCSFCGLQHIRDNGANGPEDKHGKASAMKFLTLENAEVIAGRIAAAKWNPRIEFAMHGEPTMNPNYIELVAIFRKHLPKASLQLTSNGGGLLKNQGFSSNINALMEAGLNILSLDNYDGIRIVDKILQGYNGPHRVWKYPQEIMGNPHRRRKPHEHDIVVIQDIEAATKGNHSILSNHTGGSFPLNDKMKGKRCAKPFREMSVRWDGNVAMCCNDWPGRYKIGNMLTTSVEKLWLGEAFQAARQALYHGQRTFTPCKGCDHVSYRPGLLPDAKGKETLPAPDAKTWEVIEKYTSGEPYTPKVKRPWDVGANK